MGIFFQRHLRWSRTMNTTRRRPTFGNAVRRQTPPAAPTEPLYLVTYDYRDRAIGRCTGTADLSLNQQSRREVAEQIARGLIPGAERVFECVPGERCTDISEDVARDAMSLALQQFEPLEGDLLDFLERHLGCQSVAEARREFAA